MKKKADMMILGEGQVYSTDSSVTGLNNNVIVCGSSGCGKTVSVIEPRLLETFNSSLVVTVTKRRIVEKYKEVFRRRGYNVLDLNFAEPSKSDVAYDPLQYVSDNCSDIFFLAQSIVKANHKNENSNADPYWDEAATSLLAALIAIVVANDKNDCCFDDVLKLKDKLCIDGSGSLISTSLDSMFKEELDFDDIFEHRSFRKYDKLHSFAVNKWNTFKNLPVRTAACVYSTLSASIDQMFSHDIRKMMHKNKKIEFEDMAKRKTVLFITTSAVNPSINCFVNMFYSQMFKRLFEYSESLPDGKLPIPVSVLADDFATGSPILNFPEYISIFREKQVSVTILLQSESQLERMYGHEDAITIMDNCDTYLYLGGMNIKTCNNMSTRANLPLEDILYMPIGREILFRRGQKPIVTERYNIFNNKEYKRITRRYEKQTQQIHDSEKSSR